MPNYKLTADLAVFVVVAAWMLVALVGLYFNRHGR